MLHADLGKLSTPATGRLACSGVSGVRRRRAAARTAVAPGFRPQDRDASDAGMTLRYAFSALPLCIRVGCQVRTDRVGKCH